MHARAVIVRDPFNPGTSRETLPILRPMPISALALPGNQPFIILRNGVAVLRKDWEDQIMYGDLLAVVVLPQDGGGGGGSNPLQVVAMLALVVFAPQIGFATGMAAFEAGVVGTIGMGITAAQIATGAVLFAGAALINALIPPPSLPSPQQQATLAAPSPTYNLQAHGNTARLGQAIPVQYGRLRIFPDFAAMPYTEYAGNEQFVYSLLCIGCGEYEVETTQVEDTPAANFEEITTELIEPHGAVTLFPTNVITAGEVSGQELLEGEYVGPFVANSTGTSANYIGIDVVMPRGLYHFTSLIESMSLTVQVEARAIDDNGDYTGDGSYTVLGTETFTFRTTTPQRSSLRYAVSEGRYEVRMTRTDTKQIDTSYGHEVVWAALRAYLPETRDFGPVTMLALRMRASNNLSSQSARKVNVICTRKIPIWNGSEWSAPTASTSIAWAAADMARNTDYGAGQADSRIDLAALLALDTVWTSRGDQFNGRFDSALSFWEALSKTLLAGRAKPFTQGGVVRVTRDSGDSTPVALFSMRNIARGSFSVQYLMPDEQTADAVNVTYFDRNFWAPRTVECTLPGGSATKPVKVDLFGVTGREQAFREGVYQSAANRYRRKIIKFGTSAEGFIPSVGDLIAVSHDMPEWGQFSEATGWDADTYQLTVTEPMGFTEAAVHYIGLRKRDGGVSGPYYVTQGADEYTLQLVEEPDFVPYTGMDEERTHVVFGPGETWRQPAKVISVTPRGLYNVDIEAINEDPSVHSAEEGRVSPAVQYSQLTTLYTAPVIAGLTLRSSTSDVEKALITWTPAPGALSYQIEMAAGTDPFDDELAWTRVAETTASSFAVTALYGANTIIRVRGVGLTVGPWAGRYYGTSSDYFWTADTDLFWGADGDFFWG